MDNELKKKLPRKPAYVVKQTKASKLRLEHCNPNENAMKKLRELQERSQAEPSMRNECPERPSTFNCTSRFPANARVVKARYLDVHKNKLASVSLCSQPDKPAKPAPFKKPLKASEIRPTKNLGKPTNVVLARKSCLVRKSSSLDQLHKAPGKGLRKSISQNSISKKTVKFEENDGFNCTVFSSAEALDKGEVAELQKCLQDWIRQNGKEGKFMNLMLTVAKVSEKAKPAATPDISDDENKENIETPYLLAKSDSYEDLTISQDIPAAFLELLQLIRDGYPVHIADRLLDLIEEKQAVQSVPEFWECKAAIQEAYGQIAAAVDCYHNAIVNGADASKIDRELDELLKKFNILSVNPDGLRKRLPNGPERAVLELKNIFKSTVIKFAIQMKKNSTRQQYMITPVRRSVRLCAKGTPGVELCDSIKKININVLHNSKFMPNKALK